ncbi:MAG: chemotaxis response regulator protein-glutamate methylesterase [Spirochaetales bacterium]|nr:chemotaxis response regulator protein-glutamate methylesterase [Spirochaetales bacterium]
MNEKKISVMVCDDSALMRKLISRIIDEAEDMEVVGTAMNGQFALQKIPRLNPDILILDLEMPQMSGIEFLRERKRLGIDIPVVILSSIARRGAKITMDALDLGASDFIMKPSGSISEDIRTISERIVKTVRAYALRYIQNKGGHADGRPAPVYEYKTPEPEPSVILKAPNPLVREMPARIQLKPHEGPIDMIAIGISTGGPNALRIVLGSIRPDCRVPILIVQHMPAGFTAEFAKSLDRICALEVHEACDGDIIKPGRVFIAPGDRHLTVVQKPLANIIRLLDDDPVNGHRPSVDVLFDSVAKTYGRRAMAIIMTGMGKDGARKIGDIAISGGLTIGQDEPSCVVYGMPKVAYDYGYLHHVVSLNDMAGKIHEFIREFNN